MKEIHNKLGEVLKLERERRKITLEDASEQLKISQTHLEYVEQGLVDEAPSELYFGLFAKSYAEYLGIDYTATLDAIKDELGEFEAEAKGPPADDPVDDPAAPQGEGADKKESGSAGISKKTLGWIGIGMASITVLLLVWILAFDGGGSLPSKPDESTAGSIDGTDQQAAVDQTDSELASYQYGTPPSGGPDPIQFRMIASQPVWATILADGDTVVFRNLTPGRQYDVEADYRLRVSLSLPRVVRTYLNGTEVNLRDAETNRIVRVNLTQVNLDQYLTAAKGESELTANETSIVPPAPASVSSPGISPVDSLNQDNAGGL